MPSVPAPDRLYRVSWRRAKWAPATTANHRYYLRRSAAVTFAEKILAAAQVTDEIVGVRIEYRELVAGDWIEIEELQR